MTTYRNIYQDLPGRVNRVWQLLSSPQDPNDRDDLSVTTMLMAAAAGLAMPLESLKGGSDDWKSHPAFQGVEQAQYKKSLKECDDFLKKPISDCEGLKSCDLMICTDLRDIRQTAEHPDQAHAILNKEKTTTRQALKILRNALAHNNIVDLPGHGCQIEKLVFFSKNNWCSSCQRMDDWHVLVISVDAFKEFLETWFDMLKDEDSYLAAAKAVANE